MLQLRAVRLTTGRALRRPSHHLIRIILEDSDFIKIKQRRLDATRTDTKRQRLLALPDGLLYLITQSKTCFLSILNFLRATRGHSLVGLDNGAMLLIGGYNPHAAQIWQLKDHQWSKLRDLQKVFQNYFQYSKILRPSALDLHSTLTDQFTFTLDMGTATQFKELI